MLTKKILYILPAALLFMAAAVPGAQAQPFQANNLEPNMSRSVLVPDNNPALSAAVKFQLGSQVTDLDTPDIKVVSDGGTVKLIGKVKDMELRDEAERIARDVTGVTRVINDLWVGDLRMDSSEYPERSK